MQGISHLIFFSFTVEYASTFPDFGSIGRKRKKKAKKKKKKKSGTRRLSTSAYLRSLETQCEVRKSRQWRKKDGRRD